MTKEDIQQKITELIWETFEVHGIEINQNTVADDIPGWDSLSNTVLMLTIEQAFSIKLPDSSAFKNIGELVDVIAVEIKKLSLDLIGDVAGCSYICTEKQAEKDKIKIKSCFNLSDCDEGDLLIDLLNQKDIALPYGRFTYPCRLRVQPDGAYLNVQFHGNNQTRKFPLFARWNYGKILGAHVLAIDDPTLSLDKDLTISWYLGTQEENAIDGVVNIALRCAEAIGISAERIVFSGSSGGGFAALQAASRLPFGKAVVINPQIELSRFTGGYKKPIVQTYVDKVSGCSSLDEAITKFDDRWDAVKSISQAHLEGRFPKVVYVQNINDFDHFQNHYAYFANKFCLSMTEANSVNGNFMSILYKGPNSHEKESADEVNRINTEGIPFLFDHEINIKNFINMTEINLLDGKIIAKIKEWGTMAYDCQYACYLIKDGEIIEKTKYQSNNEFVFETSGPGDYKCRGYVINIQGEGSGGQDSEIVKIVV